MKKAPKNGGFQPGLWRVVDLFSFPSPLLFLWPGLSRKHMARIALSVPGSRTDFASYSADDPTKNQEQLAYVLGNILFDLEDNAHKINVDVDSDISTINTALATWLTNLNTWGNSVASLDEDTPVPQPPSIPDIPTIGDIGLQILYHLIRILISIVLERLRGGKDNNQDLYRLLEEGLFTTYDGETVPILKLLAKEDVKFEFVESGGKLTVYPAWNAWDVE